MKFAPSSFTLALILYLGSQASAQVDHTFDLTNEGVFASDIQTLTTALGFRSPEYGARQYSLEITRDYFAIDYQPNALLIGLDQPREFARSRHGIAGSVTQQLNDKWRVGVTSRYARGYGDFRSIWIDEYYRQLFSGFSNYETAHPYSYGIGTLAEYRVASGDLSFDLSFERGHEEIAPGYERILGPGGGLQRDDSSLRTYSSVLGSEHYLTQYVRIRHEVALLQVSGRDFRASYRGRINAWLSQNWVVRSEASYTREGSAFHAWAGEATLERDWSERWYLGLTARYYVDNGQIENSLFSVTTAAPALRAYRLTTTLRYDADTYSFSLYAGPYSTRYDDPSNDITPFINLYRDRMWLQFGAIVTIPLDTFR